MYSIPNNVFQIKVSQEVDENSLQIDSKNITNNLIQQIITLKDESGQNYIQKYGIDSILGNIQKHQIEIVQLFQKYLKDGFNILQFVRFFLNIIPHNHIENLYLTIGLIDLFREIALQTHKDKIILKDITDYMCDKILENDKSFNKIKAKFLPIGKFIRPTLEKKSFLQILPTIYGETDQKIHKLCQKCIKTDCSKHSRAIIKSQFSFDLKKVFILDSLTESISVYDDNCNLTQKISPVLSKLKKEVIILDFAFSQRQFRVGAVLKDFSIKFWDHFVDFEYQKSISTTSICQNLQTSIYFLQYFNKWLTADKTGFLHLWNLLEEKPDRNFKCKYHANINDIAQISALNLLAVVQEIKRNSKLLTQTQEKQRDNGISQATVVLYNFYNGHIITQIDLQGHRIPHTIVYSQAYQVLFMSGLQKKVKIYDVHPRYMDASLKGELVGHQNLITCFTLIRNTPMLVSADDKGKVKLWDFRCFTCLQTIDFSDKTVITNLLDMIQIGKLGVFGSRVNYIEFEDRNQIIKKQNAQEILKIQSVDFDPHLMEMFIYANKALRVIDLFKGQVKHIFNFKNAPSDQQFTYFRYFSCIKKIIMGSSRGEVSIYNPHTGELQSTLKECHQGSINFIDYDQLNKIFISTGYDSKILIHKSSDGTILRQLKNNFNGKEINCVQVSVYHNILLIGSNASTSVYLWNYEYGKIIGQIKFQNQYPIAIHIINGFSILLIATSAQKIHMFRSYISNRDLQMEYIDSALVERSIVNVYSDLKLKGKGKNTQCQIAKIVVSCQSGQLYQFDIQYFLKTQNFKMHCKQKSNYNPYRQCKQNFISQIQKIKHKVLIVSKQMKMLSQPAQIFKDKTQIVTDFTSINISKLLRLEKSLNLVVGNDRRIKIWNQTCQLLCDYNINYCLPYKWDLKPLSMGITTEKIYYGIKVLQTIFKKYQNDISIGESKNIQIKELFQFIEKINNDKKSIQRVKMITQPNEIPYDSKISKKNQAPLLQNQYSRKDLNFELIKKFNFTEIAGPTLKELDNIKKIQMLQRQWKVKENKQQKQKEQLLKNIQSKAKKNQQKEQIQTLFVKQKKRHVKEPKVQYQSVTGLLKKLNSMENKSLASSDQKKTIVFFYKNLYNRFAIKGDIESSSSIIQKKVGQLCQSQSRLKRSFEGYYKQKYNKQLKQKQKTDKEDSFGFRDILTEMNGRVNSIKKYRYRPQIGVEK